VTTVWQWCRSRSSMLTAVVCSGRKRPQDSNGQWLPMPNARRSSSHFALYACGARQCMSRARRGAAGSTSFSSLGASG
jgi:hypothetical protein